MRDARATDASGPGRRRLGVLRATLLRPLGGCLFLTAFSGLDVAPAALVRGGQPLTARHRDGVTLRRTFPRVTRAAGQEAGSSNLQGTGGYS